MILWRKCKISSQTRSIFSGTAEECEAEMGRIVTSLVALALSENPRLDETTIRYVEGGYFRITT